MVGFTVSHSRGCEEQYGGNTDFTAVGASGTVGEEDQPDTPQRLCKKEDGQAYPI